MRWQEISWTRGTWTIPGTGEGDETMNIALSLSCYVSSKIEKPHQPRMGISGNGRTGHLVDLRQRGSES